MYVPVLLSLIGGISCSEMLQVVRGGHAGCPILNVLLQTTEHLRSEGGQSTTDPRILESWQLEPRYMHGS